MSRTMSSENTMKKQWRRFLDAHGISTWVTMAHLRHWVEYRGEKDGIPNVLLAYMRGHAVKSVTEGRLGYSGNRKAEAVLEDQAARWPDGPCGAFMAGQVKIVDEPNPYLAVMAEYQRGNMTTDEMARRMESIRLRGLRQVPNAEA